MWLDRLSNELREFNQQRCSLNNTAVCQISNYLVLKFLLRNF